MNSQEQYQKFQSNHQVHQDVSHISTISNIIIKVRKQSQIALYSKFLMASQVSRHFCLIATTLCSLSCHSAIASICFPLNLQLSYHLLVMLKLSIDYVIGHFYFIFYFFYMHHLSLLRNIAISLLSKEANVPRSINLGKPKLIQVCKISRQLDTIKHKWQKI